jgi:hypothetical protein
MLRHHARSTTRAIFISGTTVLAAVMLASCQSSSGTQSSATLSSAAQPQQAAASADDTMAAPQAVDADTAQGAAEAASPADATSSELALAAAPAQSPAAAAACAIALAGGPPPVPPRGADFGSAVASNVGKGAQRGALRILGAQLGGQIGAIAGDVAANSVRPEEEVRGVWKITDGRSDCGCELALDAAMSFNGTLAKSGKTLKRGCTNPALSASATWALGHSFTGYGAKLEFFSSNRKTVVATMTREGIHYFKGTLSDGTPVTMWREGENSRELAGFRKTAN